MTFVVKKRKYRKNLDSELHTLHNKKYELNERAKQQLIVA